MLCTLCIYSRPYISVALDELREQPAQQPAQYLRSTQVPGKFNWRHWVSKSATQCRRAVWRCELLLGGCSTVDWHTQHCCCISVSLSLPLSFRFNGHFPGEPGLAGVHWSKGWWKWWWQPDYWSYKSCKVPVTSLPPANQHPVFYRPDALLPFIIFILIFTSQHNGEGYDCDVYTLCVCVCVWDNSTSCERYSVQLWLIDNCA